LILKNLKQAHKWPAGPACTNLCTFSYYFYNVIFLLQC